MKTTSLKTIDCVVYGLIMVGALNWGMVGLFGINLVTTLFGPMTFMSRLIYCVVGLAAVYDIVSFKAIWKRWHIHYHEPAHV
jgi:uncharacterized membrane protein YuzA (DUF378 family)